LQRFVAVYSLSIVRWHSRVFRSRTRDFLEGGEKKKILVFLYGREYFKEKMFAADRK
jgi:hypothetical protein